MIHSKYAPYILSLSLALTLLGILSAFTLPNSLLPRIDRPEIELFSNWNGKNAQQIEQVLVAPLERSMSGLNNLISTESKVYGGFARTSLSFHSSTDMQQAYIDVLSRINQVPGWPAQVEKPFIQNNAFGDGNPIVTAMMHGIGNRSQDEFIHAYKNHIEPTMSKILGVTRLANFPNPIDKQLDIEFDPTLLARYSLSIDDIAESLTGLSDRSGGNLTLGSKDFNLLFKGNIPIDELNQYPIYRHNQHLVRLQDVAELHVRVSSNWRFAAIDGQKAMYFQLIGSPNVNALDTIDRIKTQVKLLNTGPLKNLGMKVVFSKDDSKEIKQALKLVYGSLLMGILLASVVLYWFLRSWPVVLLVFVSIPVCLSLVMLAMKIAGFGLNVISLAGMALSVGLLLDAAIVVVENILRIRHGGSSLSYSITEGARQVRGAVLSSTLSSIIVFLPILLMQTSESQLFEDLAFTISSALMASVLVALLLIPTLARYLLKNEKPLTATNESIESINDSKWTNKLVYPAKNNHLAMAVLTLAIPVALLVSAIAKPNFDVLPNPKKSLMNAYIRFNEPMNHKLAAERVAKPIFKRIEASKNDGSAPPYRVSGLFCEESNCFLYFYPDENWDAAEFETWLQTKVVNNIPGTRAFTFQGDLLSDVLPGSRESSLDIKGDSLENLQIVGQGLMQHLQSAFPNADISEDSPLYNDTTRIEFTPIHDNLIHFGLSQNQLNRHLVALTGGLYMGQFFHDGNTLPFYLKAKIPKSIDTLLDTQIQTPHHGLQPLSLFASAKMALAPSSLLRIEGDIAVSLELTPEDNMPMGLFMDNIKKSAYEYLATQENKNIHLQFRGSADRLNRFLKEFGMMFGLALAILLLLMWLTLKSWKLAGAVMLSMPLAIAGGMLNLQLLNMFSPQNLDVITMIGFIILMGLVINNAILLASQYEIACHSGLCQLDAIKQAIRLRKRPIYMSTGTTIFGMLPLMLSPGEGSEIYRGLAAVIVGGMTFSALFSLSFMSALLSLKMYGPNASK